MDPNESQFPDEVVQRSFVEAALSEELELLLPTGVRLAAKTWGDPESEMKAICFHGLRDNAATFENLAPLLVTQLPLYVVAVDFVGHGKSDHSPTHDYNYPMYVRDVGLVLNELGWETCILIGHSMGGQVSMLAAGMLGERVSALISIDAVPFFRKASSTPNYMLASVKETSVRAQKKWRSYDNTEECVTRLVDSLGGQILRSSARKLIKRGTVSTQTGVRFRHDLALKSRAYVFFSEEQLLALIKAIKAPTLFIIASHGILKVNKEWGVFIREWMMAQFGDKIRLGYVKGEHHVHLDAAEDVAALVVPFLKKEPLPYDNDTVFDMLFTNASPRL